MDVRVKVPELESFAARADISFLIEPASERPVTRLMVGDISEERENANVKFAFVNKKRFLDIALN